MVSITLSVPEEVRKTMKEFPEVNWSALIRKTIEERSKTLLLKREFMEKFQGNKEQELIDWSVKLGRKAKRGRLKRLKKK